MRKGQGEYKLSSWNPGEDVEGSCYPDFFSLLSIFCSYYNGSITRKQTEELIDAGTTKAFRMLRELCESGKLTAVGKGKISKYVLK